MRSSHALVIESDSHFRTILAIILEEEGLKVLECDDVRGATEIIQKFHPHYIAHGARSFEVQALVDEVERLSGIRPQFLFTRPDGLRLPDLKELQRSFKDVL